MTKGTSTRRKNRLPGSLYGNFDPGNNDKLMISYRRDSSHDYTMSRACGVLYEGEMNFFGGWDSPYELQNFTRQHFVIETERSGQLIKMTKKKDLKIGLKSTSCRSFEMTNEYFPWFRTNVVILCFDGYHLKSCYSFDGQLTFLNDSNFEHYYGGLTKYNGSLLTVGGSNNKKTEILKIDKNKNFRWFVIEQELKFVPGPFIRSHSLVTVESSDINEEYVLLIGGDCDWRIMKDVFKFNGTWFPFGQLNKPRLNHNSIYWNDAVYVIGGQYPLDIESIATTLLSQYLYKILSGSDYVSDSTADTLLGRDTEKTKMEIWNIKDSPDQFRTKANWPKLDKWIYPKLFIVPDSFFPDH